jgi:hypothetical protein
MHRPGPAGQIGDIAPSAIKVRAIGWWVGPLPAQLRLLDATGALYLDTQESRGLVPADARRGMGRV